jgi:hypothetical protein
MVLSIRRIACAAVFALAPLSVANACDIYSPCCEYIRVRTYVTTYETRTEWVVVEDECGCPRRVPQTYTVPIRVPVTRLVKVCH